MAQPKVTCGSRASSSIRATTAAARAGIVHDRVRTAAAMTRLKPGESGRIEVEPPVVLRTADQHRGSPDHVDGFSSRKRSRRSP